MIEGLCHPPALSSWRMKKADRANLPSNRLSTISSRNKRLVGGGLQQLSRWLDFRCIEGLAERVIFRELYPRGLTAVDDVDEVTLGVRPTMSHVTARLEMQNLLGAILLGGLRSGAATTGHNRAMG